ncbi:MAG: sulfatase-like hydrolase/transferase [Verrucomicrobiaceae bacterium]|nr:sulfatase-like hydrolase/transferase [Verrucomicrobiaceae bacterium]
MNLFRACLFCLLSSLPAFAVTNVIVIVADDLSWHDLGCMGAADVLTPHIDSLAVSGVKFTHAYSTAPVCSPSRAGLLTGRYQQRFGQETNPGPTLEGVKAFGLPLTEATMGNRFKDLGFATGWIGKSHLGAYAATGESSIYHPLYRGFDTFFGFLRSHHNYWNPTLPADQEDPILSGFEKVTSPLGYLTIPLGERCVQFIEDHQAEPFFLLAPFSAVHFDDHYLLPAPQVHHDRVEPVIPQTTPPPLPEPQVTRHDLAAVLAALDDAVGAILAKLSQRGIIDDTLIIFTSDNGGDTQFGANNGGLRGRKTEIYEGGIRVPMLMKWGTRFAGTVKHEAVSTLDILPTAIAATGNIVPEAWQLDGVNLLPWLSGQAVAPSRKLFWRMETDGLEPGDDVKDGLRAILDGEWKLVKPGANASWELYHLSVDPDESDNLASAEPLRLHDMIAAYEAWSTQLARPRWAWNNLNYSTPDFLLEDVTTGPAGAYVEPPETFTFACAELNNEICTAVVTGHAGITLLRASMTPFATLTVPARHLYSVKARTFNGVTYFSCVALENNDPMNPGATEMYLLGLGPDANHRLVRRVDEPGGATHHHPDTLVQDGELFFTYARGTEGRIARTGLRLSDSTKAPTGFTSLSFTESQHAAADKPMHGTETTHLVTHQHMLFAGQGSAGVTPGEGFTGAQILRKDGVNDDWVVDLPKPDHRGVETLAELTFGTDKVLVAGFSDLVPVLNNIVGVRTRISAGVWVHSTIPSVIGGVPTSLASRGQDIFAGLSSGEIHRGLYSPGLTQRFDWSGTNPEHTGTGRVTGIVSIPDPANAATLRLYAACGLGTNGVGGLYLRDELTSTWTLVYRWLSQESLAAIPEEQRLLRGLTVVPDPRGSGKKVLLAARSWPGVIERIDPSQDHAVTIELDVRDFFARRWNDSALLTSSVIIGYNGFTPMPDPVTGEIVHLISVWIDNDAHFLIRHTDGTYEAADMAAGLRATRCFALSPFAEDAIYIGGHDNSIAPGSLTAWIMRGEWTTWPRAVISQPDPPLLQLTWPATAFFWQMEKSTDLSVWQSLGGLPTSSSTMTTQSIAPGADARAFYRLRRTLP